jgi:hypothetical protein
MVTLLRRVFWLAVIGGAGFAGWSAWSRRNAPAAARPPEWPPIEPPTPVPGPVSAPVPAPVSAPVSTAAVAPQIEALANEPTPAPAAPAQIVSSPALTWVAPDSGSCPASHPIKANSNSGIFHVPGGRFYNQTRAERCYALAEDAEADGYRRSKS